MGKVNAKIKWQKDAPCVTTRVSGQWVEVIQALHSVATNIRDQAEARGLIPQHMKRERAGCHIHEAVPPPEGLDPTEYDDVD